MIVYIVFIIFLNQSFNSYSNKDKNPNQFLCFINLNLKVFIIITQINDLAIKYHLKIVLIFYITQYDLLNYIVRGLNNVGKKLASASERD